MATVVEGDPKAHFSLATTYQVPFFKVFGMSRPRIELRSAGPLTNTVPNRPMGRDTRPILKGSRAGLNSNLTSRQFASSKLKGFTKARLFSFTKGRDGSSLSFFISFSCFVYLFNNLFDLLYWICINKLKSYWIFLWLRESHRSAVANVLNYDIFGKI